MMQLTLELIAEPDVKECLNRVLVNECGRVAELVFEQVKDIHPQRQAVKQAQTMLAQ